jgi:hypothetical protein
VNPSKTTESPSFTNLATASRKTTTSATPNPYAHPCRVLLPLTASGESEASRLRLFALSDRLFVPSARLCCTFSPLLLFWLLSRCMFNAE